MRNLKRKFESTFEKWIEEENIKPGVESVSINTLHYYFTIYVGEEFPVTKKMLGRCLSVKFFKKQNTKTGTQEYYINKKLK